MSNSAIDTPLHKEYSFFTEDLKKIHHTQDLPVFPHSSMVVVLAGRSSALKEWVDHPNVVDLEDDHDRMLHGIAIAEETNALRAGKDIKDLVNEDRVTFIYYCGREKHIKDLQKALDQGVFAYPRHLFKIHPTGVNSTKEQVDCLSEFVRLNPSLFKHTNVLPVVSSAFHLPRVAHTIGKDSSFVQGEITELNILLYGIDRQFARPGIKKDLYCEPDALKNYSAKKEGAIARYRPNNTFLSIFDLMFNYLLLLMKKQPVFTPHLETKESYSTIGEEHEPFSFQQLILKKHPARASVFDERRELFFLSGNIGKQYQKNLNALVLESGEARSHKVGNLECSTSSFRAKPI